MGTKYFRLIGYLCFLLGFWPVFAGVSTLKKSKNNNPRTRVPSTKHQFNLDDQALFKLDKKNVRIRDLAIKHQYILHRNKKAYNRYLEKIFDGVLLDKWLEEQAIKKNKSLEKFKKIFLHVQEPTDAEVKELYENNVKKGIWPPNRLNDMLKKQIKLRIIALKQEEKRTEAVTDYKAEHRFKTLTKSIPPLIFPEIHSQGYAQKGALKNPKVVIHKFGSYTCGHCRQASKVLKEILEKFPKKVQLIYMDFSTSGIAKKIAQGSYCAGNFGQGKNGWDKYWEYHYLAYNQATTPETEKDIFNLAKTMNLDLDQFKNCLNSKKAISMVEKAALEGERLGIDGTPVVFINHIKFDGYDKDKLIHEIKKYF